MRNREIDDIVSFSFLNGYGYDCCNCRPDLLLSYEGWTSRWEALGGFGNE